LSTGNIVSTSNPLEEKGPILSLHARRELARVTPSITLRSAGILFCF
jgi:hypothetical protein